MDIEAWASVVARLLSQVENYIFLKGILWIGFGTRLPQLTS